MVNISFIKFFQKLFQKLSFIKTGSQYLSAVSDSIPHFQQKFCFFVLFMSCFCDAEIKFSALFLILGPNGGHGLVVGDMRFQKFGFTSRVFPNSHHKDFNSKRLQTLVAVSSRIQNDVIGYVVFFISKRFS